MSYSATKVIGEAALRAVIKELPYIKMWEPLGSSAGETHIEWAQWADAMLIAPCTASCISSLHNGSYDSTVTLVAANIESKNWYLAPAMSQEMWEQPAVKRNVSILKKWGANFLGPVQGKVASGDTGQRLMEPRDIATKLTNFLK